MIMSVSQPFNQLHLQEVHSVDVYKRQGMQGLNDHVSQSAIQSVAPTGSTLCGCVQTSRYARFK